MECCKTCRRRMTIERLDYTGKGCRHSVEEGYACLAVVDEGIVYHLIGVDMADGHCEMYERRRDDTDT